MFVFVTQVGGLMKNLPFVAALTAERDGEIRKAALNTLATAYKSLGMHPPFSSLLTR
jgi:cytoskeleton-associated protein 5